MKLPCKGLSHIQKLFISLSLIFVIAIIDYQSFLLKSKKIELYDDLNYKLSTIRVSIAKLEYLLDMFVVARRFESTTVELIKGDVEKLDQEVTEVLGNPKYHEVLKTNKPLSQGIESISEDWLTIKSEIKRLNDALSQDELMLIHNAVDMNTLLVTEKTDRFLLLTSESRKEVFADTKMLAMKSVFGFVLLVLVSTLIINRKLISPIDRMASVVKRIASGESGLRFAGDSCGTVEKLGGELNLMFDSFEKKNSGKEKENAELFLMLKGKDLEIEIMKELFVQAGRSISQGDTLSAAVRMLASSGMDAVAVYMKEGGELRLKASSVPDGSLPKEVSIPKGGEGKTFSGAPAEFPDKDSGGVFASTGFGRIALAPITYNRETTGYVFAASKDDGLSGKTPFIEAVASGIGVSAGHTGLLQKEHGVKRFMERVINQMPFGVAVFDRDGSCIMQNIPLKKLLGADQKFNFVDTYKIFEDQVLSSQGLITSIRKSYEGYSTEFVVNYSPALVTRYSFSGAPRRLKIKSLPLYDATGEISNIMLLYEECAEESEFSFKSGEAK